MRHNTTAPFIFTKMISTISNGRLISPLQSPNNLRSGVYGIRLKHGKYHDTIPLFVCPPLGQRTSRLCLLVSTFTYTIYGNHARPDYDESWQDKITAWDAYPWNPAQYPHYGCSTYNFHSDRSGICHASHRRPLFNLRPGYLTFGANTCSGLRHFQADSHLTAWLEHQGYEFDVVTDKELNEEGHFIAHRLRRGNHRFAP